MRIPTLVLTGTVGAGKSTVAAEINDTLGALSIPNAAIDLDALTWQWPAGSQWNADLMFENLAALWPNYRARGITHLVLAYVLTDSAGLDRVRAAIPGSEVVVCRLVAPETIRLERLIGRMPPGPSRDWHLARTGELESSLDRACLEDFVVENGDRPVRHVALEVLLGAGWISTQQAQSSEVTQG